jgi:RNase P subunit RPR2
MKTCHICKTEKDTGKQTILIELKHQVAVPLTMKVEVCQDCTDLLATVGIQKVRNTKLVLANKEERTNNE